MKKRFFLILTLAVVLLLAGKATALATTADDGHAHWAWCDTPTVCAECGETYSGPDVRHDIQWGTYASDAEYHWYPCSHCDAKILKEPHYARCTNPNICAICKAECNFEAEDVAHSYVTKKIDEQYHATFCNDCGQMISEKIEHIVNCDDDTHTCVYCFQPCAEWQVEHVSSPLTWDEKYHWRTCIRCDEELYRDEHSFGADNVCFICEYERKVEPTETPTATPTEAPTATPTEIPTATPIGPHDHWAWCNNTAVCAECGEPYSGSDVRHDFDKYIYASDEEYHWNPCKRCDAKISREKHRGDCRNSNVCYICKAEGKIDAENLGHWEDEYSCKKLDEQYHATFCMYCNQMTSEKSEHIVYCDDNSHTCIFCYQPCPEAPVKHDTWPSSYGWDENNHWYVCNRCQEKVDIEEHIAACSAPGTCRICGAKYTGSNIQHGSLEEQHDEKYHWYACPDCDAKIFMGAHIYGADHVCIACGYEQKEEPTEAPAEQPTEAPTEAPTEIPTATPTATPTEKPTEAPTEVPSEKPTVTPTAVPTEEPTEVPTAVPTEKPTEVPTEAPTEAPTAVPTEKPTEAPTEAPTESPTAVPTEKPTQVPTEAPTEAPTAVPTEKPTQVPTEAPTEAPTAVPTEKPTEVPTEVPTAVPTEKPTEVPTAVPTEKPTEAPTAVPTEKPTEVPTEAPTEAPTAVPTEKPTEVPTEVPTAVPTAVPTEKPTEVPTEVPTEAPTAVPTEKPTEAPTEAPTDAPHEHTWIESGNPVRPSCTEPGAKFYRCSQCGETKQEEIQALGHDFSLPVSAKDGTHRLYCRRCGNWKSVPCDMKAKTMLGIPCEVCSICGYMTVSALTGIAVPEEPMANVSAVTAEGEAAPVLVYDLTSAQPEGSVFALCLQIVPQEGAAMPGSVRVILPCALDTANLRLVFIADGELPVDVPYGVGGGMITFNVTAPGIYALAPVQN